MKTVVGEEGQIAGVEAVIFGILVFVFGSLVIANGWAVIDAKMAASAAAREATRAFVEADDEVAGAAAAEQAAGDAIRGHGRDAARMTLANPDGRLRRCERVTMTVSYPVALASVPVLGRLGGVVTVSARHSEIVDPFRSGLVDASQCQT